VYAVGIKIGLERVKGSHCSGCLHIGSTQIVAAGAVSSASSAVCSSYSLFFPRGIAPLEVCYKKCVHSLFRLFGICFITWHHI
jgi:hypothetical protein